MKKYLMIGFAAVAFAACSNHDFETYTPEQMVKAEYDAKFIAEFGQPNPSHNWGFGVAGTRAFTRAEGYGVGPLANGNEWTSRGFLPPDPLTDGQKLRVQYYFQTHKITNPNRPDNLSQDFFMQQVYDGGDDPIEKNYENPTTAYSAEKYQAAYGNWVVGGDKMNKLTAGPDNIHILNYNNSTCGTYTNVSNWNSTDKNDKSQQHEDQIELMLNTPTSCFGYYSSLTSMQYNDFWTLVSYQDIDNYCNNNAAYQTWLATHRDKNGNPIEDAIVGDRWKRSFIGFDFEMYYGDLVYAKENGVNKTAKQWDVETPTGGWVYNGGTSFTQTWVGDGTEIKVNDNSILLLRGETDKYPGDVLGAIDGHSDFNVQAAYVEGGSNNTSLYLTGFPGSPQSDHKAINMKFIEKMYGDGYYPVAGKQLKLWVKPRDCADGYYSDWIVSFKPATQGPEDPNEEITYKGRIMAEDLTPNESSDWDFNDVVFDYAIKDNKAYILLQAAGGTLPLNVGGTLNSDGEVVGGYEVHAAFGLNNTTTMVNTGAGATHDPVALTPLDNKTYTSNADIQIFVKKKVDGVEQWMEIPGVVGKPAGKFVTDINTDWVDEFANIKYAWGNFTQWVQDGNGEFVGSGKNGLYFDRTTRNEPAPAAVE